MGNDFIIVKQHIPTGNGGFAREIAIKRSAIQCVTVPARSTGKHYWISITLLVDASIEVQGTEEEMLRLFNLITEGPQP